MKRTFSILLLAAGPIAAQAPVRFEENLGQTHPAVRFYWRGSAQAVWLTDSAAILTDGASSLTLRFAGANPSPSVRGLDELVTKTNYLSGTDPARWHTGIPNYAQVFYENVYPGVDAVLYGNREGRLEYDFRLRPGADPQVIRLEVAGRGKPRLSPEGALRIGSFSFAPPEAFQIVDGRRRSVPCRYGIAGNREIRFELGAYDRNTALVIDPVINFSTYLGGTGGSSAEAIALDADGNIYVTGTVTSNNFPAVNAMQEFFNGSNDIFVSKFDPTGTNLLFSTFLGTWGDDKATAIAVNPAGEVHVAGYTTSPGFPSVNAFQRSYAGGSVANGGDALIFKLNAAATGFVYSTFLGGVGDDFARGLALDAEGNLYVVGSTGSIDFPLKDPIQADYAGGTRDIFLAKFSPAGILQFSTLLGSTGVDEGNAIAVSPQGRIFITGTSTGRDFPLVNPLQDAYSGGTRDAIVVKLAQEPLEVLYSTYLGGTADEIARGIAVDADEHAYVTGYTGSSNFPRRNPYQNTYRGNRDIFLSKLLPDGSAFVFSTFIGGGHGDEPFGIALDQERNIFLTGFTASINFPVVDPLHGANGGACRTAPCTQDVFVLKMNAEGSDLIYSTYLGGGAAEQARGIALDQAGRAHVTGYTSSVNFPSVSAFQNAYSGGGRPVAFLTRLEEASGGLSLSLVFPARAGGSGRE